MTWRKLNLWLVMLSTVVLGAVWWASCETCMRVMFYPRGPAFVAELADGTAVFWMLSPQVRDSEEALEAVPLAAHFEIPGELNTRDFDFSRVPISDMRSMREETGSGPLGRFVAEKRIRVHESPHGRMYFRTYHLEFPLWAVWLGFIAVVSGFCRWMERRVGHGVEKKLVEGNAADRVAGDPS